MESKGEHLRLSSADQFKAGERCSTSSLIGTSSFTPKLELTRVHVSPLAMKRLRNMKTKHVNPAKESSKELSNSRYSMIVSFPLTVTLRQFISKSLRERRQRQIDAVKKTIEALSQSKKPCMAHREQQAKRKRKRIDPPEKTSMCHLVLKHSKTPVSPRGDDAAVKAVQSNEQDVQIPAKGDWDGQLKIIQGGSELNISDIQLEVQEDAIITFQPSKKRRVSAESSAAFLNDDDDEQESLDVQAKSPNPTTSGTNPSSESVSQGGRDTPSSAALQKEAGITKTTRTPVECKQLNTCENVIPKLRLGSTNSVPILSGSQLEIQTEMDVSTSLVKDTVGKSSLPRPNQVPTEATESTKSKNSSGMVILGDDDFDTVVHQVDGESPNMGGSDKQLRLDNGNTPCSTGNDCDTSSSSVVKKRLKKGSRKTIIRIKLDEQNKSASTRNASLLTERPKHRKQQRKGRGSVSTGRKKKLQVEGENSFNETVTIPRKKQKKEETGAPAKNSEGKSSCDENKSKTRKKPRRGLKSKVNSPLRQSSVVSACETQSDPKESSAPSKSKIGCKSRARKKLTSPVGKASVAAGNAVVVKRPRGRPRKTQPSVEKNSNFNCEPKLSLDLEQSVSEDSGYPSSSTTCNSRSPTEFVLTSPIILMNNTGFLHEESFQESLSPIINDSNLSATKPETDSVSDMTGSHLLDVPQTATEAEEFCLLRGVQPDFSMNENTGMEPVNSSARNLFDLDVDLLLSQDINPDQLFSLDETSVPKLESSNDEVEDILRSPSVSSCLKGLQLSGALPCDQPDPSSQIVFDKTCQSSHLGVAAIDKLCPSGPSGESTVDQLGQPAPILSPVPYQIPHDNSSEISQSSCTTTAGVKDHSPSPVEPKSTRRVILRRKYQCKGKAVDSKSEAPLQSKSGRRLKRTWKLCPSRDQEIEQEMTTCAECHSSDSNIQPEKDSSGTKMITNTDLKLGHPSPCSAGSNSSLIEVQQSTDMEKVSCELTAPAKSESAVMSKCNEKELTSNLLSSSSHVALGGVTGHECKDRAPDDTQEKPDNVAGNGPLNCNTRVIHHETDGKVVPKATKVVPSPSRTEVTMRKLQLKLKKHSTKQSCGSNCGSDGGVAGLLPSHNTPLLLVNATKEPSPAKKEASSLSMLDAALKKAKTSVHLQTRDTVPVSDVDPCEVFMFKGFLPSADSDKRQSLFGGGNMVPATGSIFSNSQGGRVGSIFAGAAPSQSTTDSSSSIGKFTTSHLADAETPASERKPDSVCVSSASVDVTPSTNCSRKFTTSQHGSTESQASISRSKPDLVHATSASAAVTPSTGSISKVTMSHRGSARTPASNSRPNSGVGLSVASLAVPSAGRVYGKVKAKPPPSASLSMSLDTILKQMEETKGDTCGGSVFTKINTMPHESRELKLSSTPSTKKDSVVSFGEVQHNSPLACNTSLSSSEISNLILAPLSVGETLDEELKGESLFATTITDSDTKNSNATEDPQVEEVSLSRDRDLVDFGEGEENCGAGHDKESKSEIFTAAAAVQLQSHESGQDLVSGDEVKDESENPPVMKTIHLSVADKEKEGDEIEDCIELFPDADEDDLLGDTSEDPPTKTSSKCTNSAKKATDQLKVKWRLPESHKDFAPVPTDDGGFGSSFEKPPQRNPYKSQQVFQWVAEQQKRKKLSPQSALPPPSSAPGGGSSGAHAPVLQLRGRGGLLNHPWPPANINSGSSPVAFVATDLPPCHSTPSQESDNCSHNKEVAPTGPSQKRQYCKYYLLQNICHFRTCRFTHCSREHAPPHIIEEMVFHQPLEKISKEELKPYVAEHQSYCILVNNFSLFVDVIKSLLDKRFVSVVNHLMRWIKTDEVKFSTTFLCRLMEMCASQYPGILPPPPASRPDMLSVGETLLIAIEESRGHLISEDYQYYINTMINFKATKRLSAVYRAMKDRNICPTTSTLFVLLRFIKSLDNSVFPLLLSDVKSSQLNPVEKASYVSRLLDCVDPVLLYTHSNTLGKWLTEVTGDVTMKMSCRCCELLYQVFRKKDQWNHVVELFASCTQYVHELGLNVCEPLAAALQRLGPVIKLITVAKMLTEEQATKLSSQFWDAILQECSKQNKSQGVLEICCALYQQKKQLSVETVSALTKMYLDQHDHSAAIFLFTESLQYDETLAHSEQPLVSVCQAMEKTKDTRNLCRVVKLLMDKGISPPKVVLQSIVTLFVAEKQHVKLAEIIKLAVRNGLILDKGFCQKALVELRHWGRDPDSVSAVYKLLRKLDESTSLHVTPAVAAQQSLGKFVNHTPEKVINPCHSTSLTASSTSSPPPPPPPSQPKSASVTLGAEVGHSSSSAPASMSLKSVLHSSLPVSEKDNLSSILKLIEENGSKGQFGAVSSILTNLPDSTERYSDKTVYSVWKGLFSSDQGAARGFSSLVKSLDQHRTVNLLMAVTEPRKPGSSLFPSDRWLVSQVGIALLKHCDRLQDWQSGFLLLHNLHLYGVHYVKLSQPSSGLPPFVPHAPSPCEVALLAVKICLKVEKVDAALEVLHGSEWIKASNSEELSKRTEVLCGVVKKCLEGRLLQEAWNCLEKIDCGGKVVAGFVNIITNLHNILLQDVLLLRETSFALNIHQRMRQCKLQCLPTVFSTLLQHLCDKKQVKLARDLCKTAICEEAYCPLVNNDLFKVSLSPGLVGVEIHLLLESHLRRLAAEVNKDSIKPLSIQFCAGSRSPLEQVLSKFIKPALMATFAGTNSATIPVPCLQQWFTANCSDWSKTCASGGEVQSCAAAVTVGQKRHFGELEECSTVRQSDESGTSSRLDFSTGHDAGSGLRLSKETKWSAPAVVACGSPQQQVKGGEVWRKEFKRAVCNAVLANIKPYYKEKFKTKGDYVHFFQLLSQNCCRMYKCASINDCFQICSNGEQTERVLTDSVLQRVTESVSGVVSRFLVYSQDMDEELGLTSGFSSDGYEK